jgi:hypothetical protein
MKSSRIITVFALIVVAFLAVGVTAKTASHGMSVHGKITALDEKAKTLSVTPSKGAAVELSWNDATKVNGGPLKDGEMATARYLKRDGKNVATIITVPAAKAAAVTTTKTTAATKH